MKSFFQKVISLVSVVVILMGLTVPAAAHSGRTDGRGGHRDNNNVSGLGPYHYHCGGYPAHLHESGYCPYRDVFPKSVTLSAEKTTLLIGESSSISAKVSPSNACSTKVSWSSSDPDIVRVSGGTITAAGFGTATITASTFNDKVGSIKITVKEVVADSITITGITESEDGTNNVIHIGDECVLGATILPENVDNTAVTWTSSAPEILNVEDGKISALQAGIATITAASSNGKTDAITFSVEEVVAERIEIVSPGTVTIGDEKELSVKFYPDNTSYKDIKWITSDTNILTVDDNGILKAVSVGTADVTAVQKDVQTQLTIEVQPIAVERVDVTAPDDFEGKLGSGSSAQLTADVYPEDATYKDITWISDNPDVISVDETGLVKALSAGTAIITARSIDGAETAIQLRVTSILIPAILIGTALLIVIVSALILVKTLKKKPENEDATDKKSSRKKTFILIGIAILLLAIDAAAGYFFTLSDKYERATFLGKCSRPEEAVVLFEELGGYKDAEEQFAQLLSMDPELGVQFAQAGETIIFGQYEQDGNLDNGKEPLEWIVLKKDEEKAMLVSKRIIDAKPYAKIETDSRWYDLRDWATNLDYYLDEFGYSPLSLPMPEDGVQSIYEWMYSTFVQEAFEGIDITAVEELRFVTYDEMDEFIGSLKDPEWTQYALSQEPKIGSSSGLMWWMDHDPRTFNGEVHGAVVREDNLYKSQTLEVVENAGVRPLILFELK